jgi:uncharacterized membrane protein
MPDETRQQLRNIREILSLEQQTQGHLSMSDRLADWVNRVASGPAFLVVHLTWFALWIVLNVTRTASFDPTLNLLMLAVSLEAIVLTCFVLRAQGRMALQAEKRAQLDLQIDMLAEQELTAMLRVLCALGERLGIDVTSCDPSVEQFRAQTDIRTIATELAKEQAAAKK